MAVAAAAVGAVAEKFGSGPIVSTMAAMVVATTMMLDTTAPRVPVMARWAPMTSLFMREMSEPVCTRVKKARGSRWTWSYSATRRS